MGYFNEIDICLKSGEATIPHVSSLIDTLYKRGFINERMQQDELRKLSLLKTEMEIATYLLFDLRGRVYGLNSKNSRR